MADTNKTILNMLLQFRRDNVFTASYVLEKGEPGFEISTNTLKIGDGSTTWEKLEIANKEVIDSLISAAISANNASYYTSAQVDQIKKDLQGALENAVDGINGTIATLATKEELAAEAKTRGEEDVKLQNAIDTKLATEAFNTWKGTHENDHAPSATQIASDIAAAVKVEEDARKLADKAITDAIGTKDDAVTATTVYGTIAKTAADIRGEFAKADDDLKDYVDGLIAAEQKTRGDADDALDGRLDTIEGRLENVSNVMDFVGAGAALPAVADSQKGDVFVVNSGDDAGKEFVFDGTEWVEFGFATANENAIAALQDRMTEAEGDIDDLEAEFADNGRVTVLEGRVDTAEDDIDALESAVGGINDRLDDHDDAIEDITGRVEALEEAVELINDAEDGILAKANAYADSLADNYDAAGAAADVKSEVIGASTDDKDANTIYGAKAYAKDYADSLAGNYDAAGSAATAKSEVIGDATDDADQITIYGTRAYAKAQAEAAKAGAEQTAEGYANDALDDAKAYTDAQLKAAAAKVKAGTANDDIIVTPDTSTGETTVAHKSYGSGTYTKAPESSSKTGDIYFFDSIATSNGHVTGGTMKSLASILEGMTFIFDGGKSTD
jgi:hypothetical protein